MVSEDFKKIIDEDIQKCTEVLEKNVFREKEVLHKTLISKYSNIIDGFKNGLYDLFYDEDGANRKANLEIMRQKLVLFKSMGYQNLYAKTNEGNITFNNTNKLESTVTISFSDAKSKIEDMSALKETEIHEILGKIDELEAIVNSTERKTKKWENAKEIIKWAADKSVDVGIALLPLIMKIGQ